MIAMTGWKRPLAAACLALCASMGDAFAPLPLAPSRRPRADGLRAASSAAEPAVSRRSAMARALTLVGGGATLGAMPRASVAKATKATAADTVAAWNTLMDVMDTLNGEATELTKAKDWDGLTELLSTKDFAEMEDNLLKLVNGPVLNTDDKKSIGTRKRYGIAADVIYGIGGIKGAIENIDNPQIESCKSGTCSGNFVKVDDEVPKSLASLKASLSEILQVCKPYKEFKRSD